MSEGLKGVSGDSPCLSESSRKLFVKTLEQFKINVYIYSVMLSDMNIVIMCKTL